MRATPPGQSSPRPEHAPKLQHLTYDTTRTGCMLGSLARGDPGRRFFLLGRRGSSCICGHESRLLVRLRGDARVEARLRAHCGCLGGGETMSVVEVQGNGSQMLIVFHMLLLLFSSRALLIDVRAVLRDPSKALAGCAHNPVTSRQGSYCDLVICRRASKARRWRPQSLVALSCVS